MLHVLFVLMHCKRTLMLSGMQAVRYPVIIRSVAKSPSPPWDSLLSRQTLFGHLGFATGPSSSRGAFAASLSAFGGALLAVKAGFPAWVCSERIGVLKRFEDFSKMHSGCKHCALMVSFEV